MRQTIYIDVLVCVNLLVDYFLLYAAAQLTGRRISRVRLCLGAMLGGAASCQLLLPPLPRLLNALSAAAVAGLMTLAAFGRSRLTVFLRTAGALLAVTLCWGGLMTALWAFAAPRGLVVNNGAVYIDIPPAALVVCTAACYAVVSLLSRYVRSRSLARARCGCTVVITAGERSTAVPALLDTGNLLCEPFSGTPVIVAARAAVETILPPGFAALLDGEETFAAPPCGVRVVPYSGVGGEGVMLAFFPDSITVELGDRRAENVRACIGIPAGGAGNPESAADGGFGAVVNPDVLGIL